MVVIHNQSGAVQWRRFVSMGAGLQSGLNEIRIHPSARLS